MLHNNKKLHYGTQQFDETEKEKLPRNTPCGQYILDLTGSTSISRPPEWPWDPKYHPGLPLSAWNGSNLRRFSNGLIHTCSVSLTGNVIWMTFFYLDWFTETDFIKFHEYMYEYIFAERTSEVLVDLWALIK